MAPLGLLPRAHTGHGHPIGDGNDADVASAPARSRALLDAGANGPAIESVRAGLCGVSHFPGEPSSGSEDRTETTRIAYPGQDRPAKASPPVHLATAAGAILHDALPLARAASSTGFGIAAAATSFGFGAARLATGVGSGLCLAGGAALTVAGMATVGPALLVAAGGLAVAGRGVAAAGEATLATQGLARSVTIASINAVARGTDAAGFTDGDGVKLFVSDDDIGAARFIQGMVTSFLDQVPPGVTVADMNASLASLALLHTAANVGGPRPLNLPRAHVQADLRRYVLPAVAIYGHWPTAFLRITEQRDTTGVDDEASDASDAFAGDKSMAAFCRITGTPPSAVLAYDLAGATYSPGYVCYVDAGASSVVVALRGTINFPADVLTDLVCVPAPYAPPHDATAEDDPDAGAHAGMLEAARRLRALVDPAVARALASRPGFRLVLTGHSLGAGVATLLATLFGPTHGGRPVECFAYGPPCTLTLAAARAARSYVTSVVCGSDVVARFGLATSVDLREALLALLAEKRGAGGTGVEDGTEGIDLEWLRTEVMTEGPKLYPGGRVVWLAAAESGEGPAEAFEADNGEFDFIAIAKGMYSNHMPQYYLREVENMVSVEEPQAGNA